MKIELDISKIITSIILAVVLYIGTTVYNLDKEQKLINYKIDQIHLVLQDLYERKIKK
jgi:YbbR domain-containing protein